MQIDMTLNRFDFDGITEKAALKLAAKTTAQAKSLLSGHVVTGRLRNSIMYRSSIAEGGFNTSGGEKADNKITVKPAKYTAYVGTNLFYAPYQEFGTRRMAPHPFLRPAILWASGQAGKNEIVAMMREEIRRGPLSQERKSVF